VIVPFKETGDWGLETFFISKESFFRMLILPGLDSVAGKFWARFVKATPEMFYLISCRAYNLHFLNLGEKHQIFSPFPHVQ